MGDERKALDTPAMITDLDVLEANLARMSAFFSGKPAKLGPNFKNHRVLALACRQREGQSECGCSVPPDNRANGSGGAL
jgi:D-serine deaminase-like pyridoxal phosphate-dependent protein